MEIATIEISQSRNGQDQVMEEIHLLVRTGGTIFQISTPEEVQSSTIDPLQNDQIVQTPLWKKICRGVECASFLLLLLVTILTLFAGGIIGPLYASDNKACPSEPIGILLTIGTYMIYIAIIITPANDEQIQHPCTHFGELLRTAFYSSIFVWLCTFSTIIYPLALRVKFDPNSGNEYYCHKILFTFSIFLATLLWTLWIIFVIIWSCWSPSDDQYIDLGSQLNLNSMNGTRVVNSILGRSLQAEESQIHLTVQDCGHRGAMGDGPSDLATDNAAFS